MKRAFSTLLLLLPALGPASAFSSPSQWTLDLPDDASSGALFPVDSSKSNRSGLEWSAYFRAHPDLASMTLGVVMDGAKPLLKNSNRVMLPASVQKIFTAAVALRTLGPQFRFENGFTGDLDSLSGTLLHPVFEVSGDPTWGNEAFEGSLDQTNENLEYRLQAVIAELRARGVKKVRGPVRVESLRPGLQNFKRPEGWRDSWKMECMAMMHTDFEANGNCGILQVSGPGRYGWLTQGVSVPVEVRAKRNHSVATALSVTPRMDSRGFITRYVVTGVIGRTPYTAALPVHQGASWLRNLFLAALESAGIAYDPELPAQSPEPCEALRVDLSSRPLLEILRQAVQYSINGVMDRIFLEVGFQRGLSDPSQEVITMFRELLKDEAMISAAVVKDGSGLDLRDRTRPDLIFQFLSVLRDQPIFQDFFSTLAQAGKSGTLAHRAGLISSPVTNERIFGKTGTLDRVTNLAGYFLKSSGVAEPFVVLSDSALSAPAARPKVDGIIVNFALLQKD